MAFSLLSRPGHVGLALLLATAIAKVSCSVQPLVIRPSDVWYANSLVESAVCSAFTDDSQGWSGWHMVLLQFECRSSCAGSPPSPIMAVFPNSGCGS